MTQSCMPRLGRSERTVLALLARCPKLPTDAVAALVAMQHVRSAGQLLRRLEHRRLVQCRSFEPGPIVGGGPMRLWSITRAGRALLGTDGASTQSEPRASPMLMLSYRMLVQALQQL